MVVERDILTLPINQRYSAKKELANGTADLDRRFLFETAVHNVIVRIEVDHGDIRWVQVVGIYVVLFVSNTDYERIREPFLFHSSRIHSKYPPVGGTQGNRIHPLDGF